MFHTFFFWKFGLSFKPPNVPFVMVIRMIKMYSHHVIYYSRQKRVQITCLLHVGMSSQQNVILFCYISIFPNLSFTFTSKSGTFVIKSSHYDQMKPWTPSRAKHFDGSTPKKRNQSDLSWLSNWTRCKFSKFTIFSHAIIVYKGLLLMIGRWHTALWS